MFFLGYSHPEPHQLPVIVIVCRASSWQYFYVNKPSRQRLTKLANHWIDNDTRPDADRCSNEARSWQFHFGFEQLWLIQWRQTTRTNEDSARSSGKPNGYSVVWPPIGVKVTLTLMAIFGIKFKRFIGIVSSSSGSVLHKTHIKFRYIPDKPYSMLFCMPFVAGNALGKHSIAGLGVRESLLAFPQLPRHLLLRLFIYAHAKEGLISYS